MQTTKKPRKQPQQARSKATVTAILDAAARILIRDGYHSLTTNAVAECAGVSIGSLYQYFPNKESLVTAVRARHGERVKNTIAKALRQPLDVSHDTMIPRLIEAIVKAHKIEPDLHQALGALPDSIPDAHQFEGPTLNVYLLDILRQYQDEISVENHQVAAFMLGHVGHALVHAILRQRPPGTTVKQMTQELSFLIRAYLTADRAAPASEPGVSP